nr:MAG TPA: hypothetical protein [Caudoviricetes sp.]
MVDLAILFQRHHMGNMPAIAWIEQNHPLTIQILCQFFTGRAKDQLLCDFLGHVGSRNDKTPHGGEVFIFSRQSKLWRRYHIYMKYMRFSSVLQDLHPNLSPFVVNVIALLR